ncbi:DoxX family protein [Phaeocystidibacter marisrubri]|uniref:DoxX family protein n=1 Tax=Phaeocystidibacter marisrubri TaxID=1577780 RepID=A0A6L3ZDD7_9FLAO|nr:DoxX family protein [Phaeocystidibacter marisrubri]KAB2815851.1 DoxX family protein [Phaeocystidibacter marisrubri]GGH66052.1 hypothetical protein GCM10011318_03620 [Phaeocystidibacter marisrubri]
MKFFKEVKSHSKGVDFSILILRLTFGGAMLVHGLSKWRKLFSGEEIDFIDPIGIGETESLVLAVFAEVVCAILLMIGWMTRFALIPLLATMMVAYFIVHWNDDFGSKEASLLYGVAYLALFITGPGQFSLDRLRKKPSRF